MYEKIAVINITKVPESRQDIIPEYIRLPDGREFPVAELTNRVSDRRIMTREQILRLAPKSSTPTRYRSRVSKYTQTERQWIASSRVAEVCERYQLTDVQAYNLINNSRMILGWNRSSRSNMR